MQRIRFMTLVTGLGVAAMGCYTLQPSPVAVPAPGTRVAFTINDAGRVALGGSMGPELRQVEGNLQAKDGDDYVVSVLGVELLQGGYQTWGGETVRINSSYVSAVYLKKFSPIKTLVAVGGVAVAISTLAGHNLGSFLDPREEPPDSGAATRRGRIPPVFRTPSMRPGLPPFLRSLNPPRSH